MNKNIHITNVCPGPVNTSMAENDLLSDGSISKKKDPLIQSGMKVQRSAERRFFSGLGVSMFSRPSHNV